MLTDLVEITQDYGLEVHAGKTKVLTSNVRNTGGYVETSGGRVHILTAAEGTDYLGRRLCLTDFHDTELAARLDKAWRKFHSLKSELCSKHITMRDRVRLFEAAVTSTLLYGSGSWTMTADREKRLKTTQRRMLRRMLGAYWREPNVTEEVESDASESNTDTEDSDSHEEAETDMEHHESWVEWMQR
eukprot:524533-Karenia_brevis.AAC.1